MFNSILLQTSMTSVHVQFDSKASVPFYVFLLVALFLIYIKLNKPNYFRYLFENTVKDSEKLDSSSQITPGNVSGIFLQISFLLLISLAFWQLPYFFEKKTWSNFFFVLAGVSVFYLVQSVGFYLFSFIIKSGDNHFPTHRLSQNEIVTLFLFLNLILAFYLPFDISGLIVLILIIGILFNLVRVSTYLTTNISTFHIILYLCTLEIIPVLFLIKFFTAK